MKCKNSYLQKISKNGNFSRYYIERFLGMSCAVDLLAHKMFPNAKEITESFGCFEAAVNNLNYGRQDNVNVVCVGDGTSPRTAAMFAFRSPWQCHSIDPAMRNKGSWVSINRLKIYSKKIQDVKLEFDSPCILIHCHAHVTLETSLKSIKAPKISIVSMECCVRQYLNKEPDIKYNDNAVWSKCNEIKIWECL